MQKLPPIGACLGDHLQKRPLVEARTGTSTAGLYAAMAKGTFPRPVRIGKKAVAWRSQDVDAWIAARPQVGGKSAARE